MKLQLTFTKKQGREPVIAKVILATGALINVEKAYIESLCGEVLIDVTTPTRRKCVANSANSVWITRSLSIRSYVTRMNVWSAVHV